MFFSTILALCLVSGIFSIRCDAVETNSNLSGNLNVILNISSESMRAYVTSFEKKYPNISVSIEYYSDYENEVKDRMATGEYGDVLLIPGYMGNDDIPQFFRPLGDIYDLAEKYDYLSESKINGDKVYGLPSSVYINGFIYNKRIFEESGITRIPTNTEEFLKDLNLIDERTSAIPFYTQYNDPWALLYWEVFPFVEMTGDSDYKFNHFIFEKEPFKRDSTHYNTYSLLYEIVNRNLAGDNPLDTDWNDSKIMLNTGEIACMVMGSWAIKEIKAAGPNPDDVAFMPFPNNINGQQYSTLAGNYCYGISKNSANPELAKAFIDYMLDESGYAIDNDCISILKGNPYPESYTDLKDVTIIPNTPATDAQYKLYKDLLTGVDLANSIEIQNIIADAANNSNKSFDSIMDDWNTRWEASRPEGEYADSYNNQGLWQNSAQFTDKQYEVTFSASEMDYIRDNPKVTVGYVDTTIPFVFLDDDTIKGLAPEITNIISNETGIQFDYISYSNQADLQIDIINGNIDMMAYAPTEIQDIQLSRPYLGNTVILVYNNDFDRDNISANSEVVISGEDYNFISDPHQQYYADTVEDALNMVFNGEAEYTVINYYSASFFVPFYSNNVLKMEPLNYYGNVSFGFCEGVDSRLISIFNKILYKIPATDMQMLLLQNMRKSNYSISFKQYLENNPFVASMLISLIAALVVIATVIIAIITIRGLRRRAKEIQKYEKLSNLIDEYIFEIDYKTSCITFDSKFKEKFNLIEKYDFENLTNPFLLSIRSQIIECQHNKSNVSEIFDYDNNGKAEHYKLLFSTINEHDSTIYLIGKIVSAEEDFKEKELLTHKSQTDPLTGLYNRDGLEHEFNRIISQDKAVPTAVMIFDLDSFKQVNDTMGHGGGDEALKHISAALAKYKDDNWIPARIGGDEFVVYSCGLTETELITRLDDIMSDITSQIIYENNKFHVTSSCGVIYSESTLLLEEGIQAADKQLYIKKASGKNGYKINTQS